MDDLTVFAEVLKVDPRLEPPDQSREAASACLDAVIAQARSAQSPASELITKMKGLRPRRTASRMRRLSRRTLMGVAAAVVIVVGGGTALASGLLLHYGGSFVPATGQSPVVHDQQTVDGGVWSVTTFVNSEGQTCFGFHIPHFINGVAAKGWTEANECVNIEKTFEQAPLFAQDITQRDNPDSAQASRVAIVGMVDTASVATAAIRLSNCQLLPIQPDATGVFLDVVAGGSLANGTEPVEVLAYNAAGSVIADRSLHTVSAPTCSG